MKTINQQEFVELLQRLAGGWNQGNAQQAADCFTEDALYTDRRTNNITKGVRRYISFLAATTAVPGK